MCKLDNPDSYNSKIAQKYLSKKVSESLNYKNKDNFRVGVLDLLRISF